MNLRQDRVILIPLRAEDASEMLEVLSPREIYEFITDNPPASLDRLRERYARWEQGKSDDGSEQWLNWIVRDGKSGEALGFVQATVTIKTGIARIAYILNPKHWGKGIASEAVSKMMDLLKKDHHVATFEATVEEQNLRSLAMLRRFGFKRISISAGGSEVLLRLERK